MGSGREEEEDAIRWDINLEILEEERQEGKEGFFFFELDAETWKILWPKENLNKWYHVK